MPPIGGSHHGQGGSTHNRIVSQQAVQTLEMARFDVAVIALYFNKAEARDKFCRAIQYGAKFVGNGQPGTLQNVERSSSLARKSFRLFKFVNDMYALLSPPPTNKISIPMIILGKAKNLFQGIFLFLDQIVWANKTGIYKDKQKTDRINKISVYSWFISCVANSIIEYADFWKQYNQMKRLPKTRGVEKFEHRALELKYRDRLLAVVKTTMDVIVGLGLLNVAPKTFTPRVVGSFGFISSLISCYRLFPKVAEAKKKLHIEAYESPH
ncbi:hypothetical protein LUZ60_011801 [Juncus effusus]|nr:hypothetical protein LUZ60_011801 [Juncus effusus]